MVGVCAVFVESDVILAVCANTFVQTALKGQLDDDVADIKRLSATVQQKLKGC